MSNIPCASATVIDDVMYLNSSTDACAGSHAAVDVGSLAPPCPRVRRPGLPRPPGTRDLLASCAPSRSAAGTGPSPALTKVVGGQLLSTRSSRPQSSTTSP